MATFRAKLPRGNTTAGRSLHAQAMQGMNDVMNNLNNLVRWVSEDVLPEEMLAAVDPTMDLSDHYAPKKTGRMVSSRYSEARKFRGQPHVEVGYNRDGSAPYTIFVHEMPQFYHEPPTQYKFLERALDEDTPEIIGRIAARVRARIGGA